MDRGSAGGGVLRVAIVGLGPKGLFALERLLDHGHRSGPQIRLQIDVFEPHAVPGAGPVYDPGQPGYLRMNLAADHLDMWWPASRSVPAGEQLSFVDWRRMRTGGDGGDGVGEAYPPRAEVGRYLADGLARLLRHLPPGVALTLRRSVVRALHTSGSGWRVCTADDAHDYQEVLLTVGHGTAIEARGTGSWEHAAPLASAVFPVGRHLGREHVPAGAAVAVRGFALTFLDAALALTEGRGGVFEHDGPDRLRYLASDADAALILPYSRSGRPLLAKPESALGAGVPALEAIAQDGRVRINALPVGFTVANELLAVLAGAAGGALRAAGEGLSATDACQSASAWLTTACDGAPPAVAQTPAQELERSLAVATGRHPPDLPWALGHTWRSVYPAIVARIGAAGLADREWPAFRRLAAQLERVAFGPPPVNAAKLLALVDAGRVDLTHVVAGEITTAGGVTSIRSAGGERRVDVVVDGVLASPGVTYAGEPRRLVGDGHARILAGRRGLDVGADAGAIGRDGRPTPGLSVLGRATEDSVIGNDTLSRSMHPQADRWAARVIGCAQRHAVAPPQGAAA